MKLDRKMRSALEDIAFKYERMAALMDALQILIAEGPAEVCGLPENTIEYSLYELICEMNKNNQKLQTIICKSEIIREEEMAFQRQCSKTA